MNRNFSSTTVSKQLNTARLFLVFWKMNLDTKIVKKSNWDHPCKIILYNLHTEKFTEMVIETNTEI